MKVSARTILAFAPWIGANAAVIRSMPDGSPLTPSARAVIDLAGPAATCEWFTQPIDHKNESSRTWEQIYCVDPQWWTPGAPVTSSPPFFFVSVFILLSPLSFRTHLESAVLPLYY